MKKATVDLFTRIFAVLAPPPNMTISQWADKYRRLSSESSAEPGQWRTSKAPYQREIMDAVCDMRIQKVVIMSAAQIGKTDALILNPIGYYMHYDPSPIMVMQPTIQMAETFSKDRLSPMLRDTPVLRDKVNDKSRNSGNTILQKIFPGGHVTMVGANSPSSLASRPIRILLADEIDRYPATAGNEGDPLLLAGKRNGTYLVRRAGHTRRFCGRISFLTGTSWTKSGALARRAAWFPAKRSGKSSSERVNSSRHTRNEKCADSI